MNVEFLYLSILQDGEASGYDIKKRFSDGEEALFANASIGAIYPALAKLEAKGQVSVAVVRQSGKPDKKVYRITPTGQDAFLEGLQAPLEADTYQSPFLYFMRFAHLLPPGFAKAQIEARGRALEAEITQIDRLLDDPAAARKCCWPLQQRRMMTEAMRCGLGQVARWISAGKSEGAASPETSVPRTDQP